MRIVQADGGPGCPGNGRRSRVRLPDTPSTGFDPIAGLTSFVGRAADCTLTSLGAAPVEVTPGISGSVREPVATPRFVGMPSDDPGEEDELEYVSQLPTMISSIPDSDAANVSAGYLEPPALAGSPTTPPVHGECATDR